MGHTFSHSRKLRSRKRVGEILSFDNCVVIGKTRRRYSIGHGHLVPDEVVDFFQRKIGIESSRFV